MSRIRGRDTKPEMLVRRALHGRGLRYRLHSTELSGKPDLVFPRHRVALFVHGCFWHQHGCHLTKLPEVRRDFWEAKLSRTRKRDALAVQDLVASGWRVLIVWECALRGRGRIDVETWVRRSEGFIRSNSPGVCQVAGRRLVAGGREAAEPAVDGSGGQLSLTP